MAHLIPIPLLIVTVICLLSAEFREWQRGIYVFKPLATVLVIVVAALSLLTPAADSVYTGWLSLGLVLSLVGDVALMFKSERAFMIGLVAFLLAHVVYAGLLSAYNSFQPQDLLVGGVLLLAALVFYRLLWPHLGRMKLPVAFYMLVICFMLNRALSTLFGTAFGANQAWLIAAGALLFFVSDLILALNRFGYPFRYHRISLAFYFSGQLLLALSASYFA